jgi:hypothetical protein
MPKAFLRGFVDGFRELEEFASGLTFGDKRDEAYDKGVNWGQHYGRRTMNLLACVFRLPEFIEEVPPRA